MCSRAEGRHYRCATDKRFAASPAAHQHPISADHLASAHARAHPATHHSSICTAVIGSYIQDVLQRH